VEIGGDRVIVMAGPCSVETRDQIERIAAIVAGSGRQGHPRRAFKPRSSPYSFQASVKKSLQLIRAAADRNGLLVISEVMTRRRFPLLAPTRTSSR